MNKYITDLTDTIPQVTNAQKKRVIAQQDPGRVLAQDLNVLSVVTLGTPRAK